MPTLAQFLRGAATPSELAAVVLDLAEACARIAAIAALPENGTATAGTNVHGEAQLPLDLAADAAMLEAAGRSGFVAGYASEERALPHAFPTARGRYLVVTDPLDGSSNVGVNVSVGSIFSVLPASDFCQPGTRQVAAGYAVYGPRLELVLSVGAGVHGFTHDPRTGEFVLSRPDVRVRPVATELAVNAAYRRFWEPAVRRYVDDCLAGADGVRGRDFGMRWVGSLVADLHRVLLRGGVFLYPRDARPGARAGRLRLVYEANPVAFLVEQAGGRASTGRERVLEVAPTDLHQRSPLVFGPPDEVELVERHHLDAQLDHPLYARRGLFRTA